MEEKRLAEAYDQRVEEMDAYMKKAGVLSREFGALRIRLAGDAWYFGVLCKKEFIGDDERPVEPEDIKRANLLMMGSEGILVLVLAAIALCWS